MNIFRVFGIGKNRILAKDHSVTATVTDYEITYLYVVRKPLRYEIHYRPDSAIQPRSSQPARYSHYIYFTYAVNGISYPGKLFVNALTRCPQVGETIDVYYDPEKPENYACYDFGPAGRPIRWW